MKNMIGIPCLTYDGSLTKQTVAVLEKYLRHHELDPVETGKNISICEIMRHIPHQLQGSDQTANRQQPAFEHKNKDEDPFSSSDEDETDFVLAEIGSSSDEEGNDDDNRWNHKYNGDNSSNIWKEGNSCSCVTMYIWVC